MEYIATFFTHFAAMEFLSKINAHGTSGHMMPVPRRLSASCGTCVAFSFDGDVKPLLVEDTEGVYRVRNDEYEAVFQHSDE